MWHLKAFWTFDTPLWMETYNTHVTEFETGLIFDTRAEAEDWRDTCWLTGPPLRQGHRRTITLEEIP